MLLDVIFKNYRINGKQFWMVAKRRKIQINIKE